MKTNCLFFLVLATTQSFAQVFTELSESPMFAGMYNSSMAMEDFDNDGLTDVLLSGSYEAGALYENRCLIYKNEGGGEFSELPDLPFADFRTGQLMVDDVDNDGDADIVMAESPQLNIDYTIRVYLNDGLANFELIQSFSLQTGQRRPYVLADLNADGFKDIFITQRNDEEEIIYLNNGSGVFEPYYDYSIYPDGKIQNVAVADFDQNGFNDILAYGIPDNSLGSRMTIFYNNGTEFTPDIDVPFLENASPGFQIADVDNDGDDDITIHMSPLYPEEAYWTVYLNDGNGSFTETSNSVEYAQGFEYVDLDMDGDLDAFVPESGTSRIYLNDGFGEFEEVEHGLNTILLSSNNGFFDFDNDGDLDFLTAGILGNGVYRTWLYENQDDLNFEPLHPHDLFNNHGVNAHFADFDGDEDNDALVFHELDFAKISKNRGDGTFEQNMTFQPVCGVFKGVDIGDIDADGDLDIISSGTPYQWDELTCTVIALNNGNGNFTEMTGTGIPELTNSMVRLADIDGDQDLDFFIAGVDQNNSFSTNFAVNDGTGNFNLIEIILEGDFYISEGIDFADIDNDGDLDMAMTRGFASNQTVKIYRNEGFDNFILLPDLYTTGTYAVSFAFTDIDGDGDSDLQLFGKYSSDYTSFNQTYENDGTGQFSLSAESAFAELDQVHFEFFDFNLDGFQDLLLRGRQADFEWRSYLYQNQGDGSFDLIENSGFPLAASGMFSISDLDNDGDQDLVLFDIGSTRATVFLNNTLILNTEDRNPKEIELTLYPNPATSGEVNVRFNAPQESMGTVEIYSAQGQPVHRQPVAFPEGESTLFISGAKLSAGLYIVNITTELFSATNKLIVQ
jgi:hypothetical protein